MSASVTTGSFSVRIQDPFWSPKQALVRDVVIPYQWQALNDQVPGVEPSHTIENFRIAAGEADGDYYGMVFQDSDLYKWLEAVGHTLANERDEELERKADEAIDLLARAQQPDGYLNTHYTLTKPDKRWTNLRDDHELYCAGHLIEAAVAYYQATGKRKLLDIACRFADYINRVFGHGPGKIPGYPGHEEIELALIKLYRATGNRTYLDLALYFIEERGRQPHYFQIEAEKRGETTPFRFGFEYSQSHLPVREQTEAIGHAVRAMYFYTAVADAARETGDMSLLDACRRLWNSVVQKKMYVTGGIGSSADNGEAFTTDYDLPNDTAYTETCAAIGLVFFAQRMLQAEPRREYADVMERALFNGVLAGMSLDGRRYFYVNPLEVWPSACDYRADMHSVKYERQGWFGCACCPPNIARLLASLGQYVYTTDAAKETIYAHLYIGSSVSVEVAGGKQVTLVQESQLPWQGRIRLTVHLDDPAAFTLALRLPGWCLTPALRVNGEAVDPADAADGYARLNRTWACGDVIELDLPMQPLRIYPHPELREDAGKVALQYGPIVYCLEEADNGANLRDLTLPREAAIAAKYEPDLLGGVVVLESTGYKSAAPAGAALYSYEPPSREETLIRAIPYYAWANRGPGEMTVWIREA
ncbi:glycoside hydrolase family 127 protein [Alicyclobacillus shizuokensis]|uniref:glycoside hydrolase family 127 protein n=1 Tax=Alicyclobacillus shizuokensis TaxID=392014 RepID=UPI0008376809|nr:beta-L-arabinofuranosidase domain-containing protein [Alicyclobacillus shizuokensis]